MKLEVTHSVADGDDERLGLCDDDALRDSESVALGLSDDSSLALPDTDPDADGDSSALELGVANFVVARGVKLEDTHPDTD